MSGFVERFTHQGREEGRQEEGSTILMRLLALKFGPPGDLIRVRVQQADPDTPILWSERVLTASCLGEVFADIGDKAR